MELFASFIAVILAVLIIAFLVAQIRRDSEGRAPDEPSTPVPRPTVSSEGDRRELTRLRQVAAEANAAPYAAPWQPPDGYALLGVSRSAGFAGKVGEYSQIEQVVEGLIRDSDPNKPGSLRWSADRYPLEWGDQLDEAVGLKRTGEFLASVQAYDSLTRSSGVIYSGITTMLYKVVAASGALRAGARLLALGQEIFESDPKSLETIKMFGGPSLFEEYRSNLEEASSSKELLERYLRGISGNVNYRMPRDYADAVHELRSA